MKKNTVGQKWRVFCFVKLTAEPVTGDALNITAKISRDGGARVALTDTNPTETEDGYYLFDLTQAETNADELDLYPETVTSGAQCIGVPAFKVSTDVNVVTVNGEPATPDATTAAAIADAKTAAEAAQVAAEAIAAGTSTVTVDDAAIRAAVWDATTRTLTGTALGVGPSTSLSATDIYYQTFAGSTIGLYAHVLDWDGTNLLQADVSSIAYTIYKPDPTKPNDPEARVVLVGHVAVVLDKTAVVWDTLQTDAWASDWNCKIIPSIATAAPFADVGTTYTVEVTFTMASGEPIPVRFRVTAT